MCVMKISTHFCTKINKCFNPILCEFFNTLTPDKHVLMLTTTLWVSEAAILTSIF